MQQFKQQVRQEVDRPVRAVRSGKKEFVCAGKSTFQRIISGLCSFQIPEKSQILISSYISLAIGTTFCVDEKFEYIKQIGHGAYGVVCSAYDH